MTDPQTMLRHLFDVAVQRALPLHNTAAHLPAPPDPAQGRTLVLGAGKAGGAKAQAGEALGPGLLNTTSGARAEKEVHAAACVV